MNEYFNAISRLFPFLNNCAYNMKCHETPNLRTFAPD